MGFIKLKSTQQYLYLVIGFYSQEKQHLYYYELNGSE